MKTTASQLLRDAANYHLWSGSGEGNYGDREAAWLCSALALACIAHGGTCGNPGLRQALEQAEDEVTLPLVGTGCTFLRTLICGEGETEPLEEEVQAIRFMFAHLLADVLEDGR